MMYNLNFSMYIINVWVKLMISNFKYGWGYVTLVLNHYPMKQDE